MSPLGLSLLGANCENVAKNLNKCQVINGTHTFARCTVYLADFPTF